MNLAVQSIVQEKCVTEIQALALTVLQIFRARCVMNVSRGIMVKNAMFNVLNIAPIIPVTEIPESVSMAVWTVFPETNVA